MNHSFIVILTFFASSLLAVSLGSLAFEYFFRYRLAVRKRVGQLCDHGNAHHLSIFKDQGHFAQSVAARRTDYVSQIRDLFGDEVPISTIVVRALTGGLAAGLLGFLISWPLVLACVPLGLLSPFIMIVARKHARRRKLSRQLPEAFQMISRAVRAGQTDRKS